MHSIDCDSAEAYLRDTGRIGPREAVRVRRLAGGVSNEVLYVERLDEGSDFVLKQARPQLRVADPWFCSVERIWREVETLRICAAAMAKSGVSEGGENLEFAVPQLLFEDRDNYAFAMSAAPPHEVWKQRLLEGKVEPPLAAACGRLLAALHAGTWRDEEVAILLRDRSFFDDLRIDPYYRRVAEVHADLKAPIADLIQSLARNCLCLVHGDFSPKNLLVYPGRRDRQPGGIVLVDFEVGHFGDPAFDLGFFLSHLALKAMWSGPRIAEYLALTETFWSVYLEAMRRVAPSEKLRDLEARTVQNAAACMLARVDGKSKVEYLAGEPLRERVRSAARALLLDPPAAWSGVIALLLDRCE